MANSSRSIQAQKGFTLVELTMAIAFISILLLSILYVIIQAGKMYTKGTTYKQVNQVSRELVDMMRRDLMVASTDMIDVPAPSAAGAGRICTGQISYVWNTAKLLETGPSTSQILDGTTPVVFRKVEDPGKALCAVNPMTNQYLTSNVGGLKSTELLGGRDGRNLAAYSFSATELANDTNRHGLYRVSMQLGTYEVGTTVYDTATGQYTCRPPTDNSANFEYCTVIEFDAVMRAGGNI